MAKSSLNGKRANEKSSSNGQAQTQDANGSLNTSNSSSSNSDGVIRVGSGFQVRIPYESFIMESQMTRNRKNGEIQIAGFAPTRLIIFVFRLLIGQLK